MKRAHPNSRWRALVVLRRAGDLNERSRDRSEQVRRVKESAKAALNEIDTILAAHHGRRLEDEPNALGYVAVEATPAGIRALTESNHVRAIIEDQAVRSVR
jgi:hypothetical protein